MTKAAFAACRRIHFAEVTPDTKGLFDGFLEMYYSYDTCLSTPDCCWAALNHRHDVLASALHFQERTSAWRWGDPGSGYTDPFDDRCPFDRKDTAWSTASDCEDYNNEVRFDGRPGSTIRVLVTLALPLGLLLHLACARS